MQATSCKHGDKPKPTPATSQCQWLSGWQKRTHPRRARVLGGCERTVLATYLPTEDLPPDDAGSFGLSVPKLSGNFRTKLANTAKLISTRRTGILYSSVKLRGDSQNDLVAQSVQRRRGVCILVYFNPQGGFQGT